MELEFTAWNKQKYFLELHGEQIKIVKKELPHPWFKTLSLYFI